MIKVENLSKNFGEHLAVSNVNLEVKEGEVITIIGPSGSGKSTFLRCINALETASSGEIFVDGIRIDYTTKNLNSLRQNVGMVFQNFNLFPNLSVLENIILAPINVKKIPREEAIETAKDLLKKVALEGKIDTMPQKLSGGQKQRIAIARALAMKPKYMLFDEPTSALDPEMVKEVLDVIQELSKTLTSIIVSHEMCFARKVSDRIIFMENGSIVEEGRAENFFNNPKNERTREFLSKML